MDTFSFASQKFSLENKILKKKPLQLIQIIPLGSNNKYQLCTQSYVLRGIKLKCQTHAALTMYLVLF